MSRGSRDAFIKSGKFTCECGREFSKSQSFYAHQSHCKVHLGERYDPSKVGRYHNILGTYRCVCGKEFSNSSSYAGHTSHCREYLGEERYYKSLQNARSAAKIAREAARTSHSEESRKRQSETRKSRYASGELTPARGVGKGKYSYILLSNGKRIMLRSTYEFIYALYLLHKGVPFEYETVRVVHNGKTFISDFLVEGTIVEIKGDYRADVLKKKSAFELAGYSYQVMYWKDLEPCYQYLRTRVDIDKILSLIKEGHDRREYFEYSFLEERVEVTS